MTENEIYIQVRNIVKTQKINSVELVGNNLIFTLEDRSKLYVNTTDNEVKITSIRTNKDGFLFVTLSTGLEFDAGRYSRITPKDIQLTIDSKVTKKSQNPVTSAGIYNYGQNLKQDILDNLPDIDSEKEVIEGHYDLESAKFYTDETMTEEVIGEQAKLYISVDTDKEPTIIDKFQAYRVGVGFNMYLGATHEYVHAFDGFDTYNTTRYKATLKQLPDSDKPAYLVSWRGHVESINHEGLEIAVATLKEIDGDTYVYMDSSTIGSAVWTIESVYESRTINRETGEETETTRTSAYDTSHIDFMIPADIPIGPVSGDEKYDCSDISNAPNSIKFEQPISGVGPIAKNNVIVRKEKKYTLYNYDDVTKDFKQLGNGGSSDLSNYYTKTEIDDKFIDIGTITQEDIDRICV